MNVRARIEFEFGNEEQARRVHEALRADDDEHCATEREGTVVRADVRGDSPRSLLRAVDDLLACCSVAEDVINGPPLERDDDAGH